MATLKPELVFAISDLHCGSTVGLLPPRFQTLEGQKVDQNVIQQWLWKCWLEANKWILDLAKGQPFALIVNGDAIEGNHHRTTQIISPDIGDHIEAALQVLRPLVAKASATFIVRGTECHTGNAEIAIGKALKCRVNAENGLPIWDRLTLDVKGIRYVFRHHIGTTMRRGLAATQLSVNLAEEQLEAANADEKIPRVLVCSHRHKYGQYQDDGGICVVTPPWQGLTRFAHKVVSQARTSPGLVCFDHSNCDQNELPKVRPRIYTSQRTQAVEI